MKLNIAPLQPETYYHIYNRGTNGENLFKEERNFAYFLQKYAKFVSPIVDTYAYCLLKNHFHLLVRTKSEQEIRAYYTKTDETENPFSSNKHADKSISWLISNNFSSLFKSHAQAITKAYKRTGALFEEPFRRIEIDSETYYTELIYYIHHNPQKHGFVADFRDYPHSSYHSHLSDLPTLLMRDSVLEWFGGKENFELAHLQKAQLKYKEKFDIEFD